MENQTSITVEYERCPWDESHILEIYRNSRSVDPDGRWHPIVSSGPLGFYRLHHSKIFQVVYSDSRNELLDEILDSEPPASEDDAEWTIIRWPDMSYSLTSSFCRTFGPFRAQYAINNTLRPYALRLSEFRADLHGIADFASLEAGCLRDAMERLRFLESLCIRLNKSIEIFLDFEWSAATSALLNVPSKPESTEFIWDFPSNVTIPGPKRRRSF